MSNIEMRNLSRVDGKFMSPFDRLTDMIHAAYFDSGSISLEASAITILLEGIERLRDQVEETKKPPYRNGKKRALNIIDEVAKQHGLRAVDLKGKSRVRAVVDARHEAIRLIARDCTRLTSVDIAKLFRKNHTTVLWVLGTLSKNAKRHAEKEMRRAA